MSLNLESLYQIIQDRQKKMPANSYTSSLFRAGFDRITQKIGEESIEIIIAAMNYQSTANSKLAAQTEIETVKKRLIAETTDFFYHLLVLLVSSNILLSEIDQELKNRANQSQVST